MLVNTRKCKPHSPVPELGPFRIPHSKDPERIPFPEKARSYLFRGSIPSVRAGRHGVQQYTIISLGEGESNLLSAGTVPFFELAGEVNNSQLSGTGKICTSSELFQSSRNEADCMLLLQHFWTTVPVMGKSPH